MFDSLRSRYGWRNQPTRPTENAAVSTWLEEPAYSTDVRRGGLDTAEGTSLLDRRTNAAVSIRLEEPAYSTDE